MHLVCHACNRTFQHHAGTRIQCPGCMANLLIGWQHHERRPHPHHAGEHVSVYGTRPAGAEPAAGPGATCTHCGAPVEAGAPACPYCGGEYPGSAAPAAHAQGPVVSNALRWNAMEKQLAEEKAAGCLGAILLFLLAAF